MTSDVSEHIQDLHSSDVQRRVEAAEALCRLGEAASASALPLLDALADADERVCEAAHAALEEIGSPPSAFVGDLAVRLNDSNAHAAFWAATLLGRLQGDASEAATALANVVVSETAPGEVRQKAAWALGRIGPKAKSTVGQLQKATSNTDARLARLAQDAIQSIES